MIIDNYWIAVEGNGARQPNKKSLHSAMSYSVGRPSGKIIEVSDAARKTLAGADFSRGSNWPDSELRMLRTFSRSAGLSGSVGPAVISARLNASVTGGLTFISSVEGIGDEIEKWWKYYCSEAVSNDGLDHVDTAVEMAGLAAYLDGDSFTVISYSEDRKKLYGIGTVIDVIPGCLVCNPNDSPNSKYMISGVEFSSSGVAVAIHVVENDFVGSRSWRRIPIYGNGPFGYKVRNVFQHKCPGREVPGMVRALPLLSPVLVQVGNLNRFREAFIQKAVNEASLNFVAKGITGVVADQDGYNAPEYSSTDMSAVSQSEFKSFVLPNGSTVYLPANGTSLEPSKFSNGLFSYEQASKPLAAEISAACDVPPEVVSRLFSSSYSAGNAALNELWRSRVPTDRAKVARSTVAPLLAAVLDELVVTNQFKIPGYSNNRLSRHEATAGTWVGPTKGAINPGAEYKALGFAEDRGWIDPERVAAMLFGIDRGNHLESIFKGSAIRGSIAKNADYKFKNGVNNGQ